MTAVDVSGTLNRLIERRDLDREDMLGLMRGVMGGTLTPAQVGALLIALRVKGETVTELAAAAEVMRELATRVPYADTGRLVDTCGTGGDGARTFNISTAAAVVAAAAGAKVAKHGGRSVSSTCGSADVLERLGVNVNLPPDRVAACIDAVGVGFMFAPNHHSAMRHAAPVRRELGVRTLFNLLGPMTNPAGAKNQVLGVFHPALTLKLARVLQALGSRHVLVVHAARGLDEVALDGETFVAELKDGEVREQVFRCERMGLKSAPTAALVVTDVGAAADTLLAVLDDRPGPARDIVALNAGAAIYVSGVAQSWEEGVEKAFAALASGAAAATFQALKDFSNGQRGG